LLVLQQISAPQNRTGYPSIPQSRFHVALSVRLDLRLLMR
jgi:hypothetical protein